MYEMLAGAIVASQVTPSLARSAQPDAPVVTGPTHVHRARVRLGLAAGLRHAADKLTPSVCVGT